MEKINTGRSLEGTRSAQTKNKFLVDPLFVWWAQRCTTFQRKVLCLLLRMVLIPLRSLKLQPI